MKLDWPVTRCIVCLGTPIESDPESKMEDAHVIPKAVGGRLSAFFLCKTCNSRMGTVEGSLRLDPRVLDLVDHLAARLPTKLVNNIRKGSVYVADTEDYGRLFAALDEKGELRPLRSENVLDDANTLGQMAGYLRRQGRAAELEPHQRAFEEAAPGDWLDVTRGYRIQKGIDLSSIEFTRVIGDPAPTVVGLGIAYLFLALAIEERVYDDGLQDVRDALNRAMSGNLDEAWPVDYLGTDSPDAKHGIAIRSDDDSTIVDVRFFRSFVWRVRFPGVRFVGDPRLYVIDLISAQEAFD